MEGFFGAYLFNGEEEVVGGELSPIAAEHCPFLEPEGVDEPRGINLPFPHQPAFSFAVCGADPHVVVGENVVKT